MRARVESAASIQIFCMGPPEMRAPWEGPNQRLHDSQSAPKIRQNATRQGSSTRLQVSAMTFLRCLPLAALGLGLTGPALAAEMRYRIDPAHSHAEFAVSHMGISTFHGKMTAINGTIRLDPETGAGQIEAQLDAEALVTGDASLDRVLRG